MPLICLATPRKLPCLPQQLGLGYPLSGSVASGNSRRGAGRTPGGWAQAEREVREAAVERPGAEAPARSCRPRRQTQSWTGCLTEAVRGPIGGLHTCPRPPASDGGALSPAPWCAWPKRPPARARHSPPETSEVSTRPSSGAWPFTPSPALPIRPARAAPEPAHRWRPEQRCARDHGGQEGCRWAVRRLRQKETRGPPEPPSTARELA